MENTRNNRRQHRAQRVRAKVSGTAECPRMRVFCSLTTISVQVIDDTKHATLVSASLKEIANAKNTVDGAAKLGALIAQKAQKANITKIVFDRGGYKYHGKVKALAEAAREAGLQF